MDQWQSSCLAHAKTWLLSQLYETQEKEGRKKTKEKKRAVKPEVAISGSGAGALSFDPFTPPVPSLLFIAHTFFSCERNISTLQRKKRVRRTSFDFRQRNKTNKQNPSNNQREGI